MRHHLDPSNQEPLLKIVTPRLPGRGGQAGQPLWETAVVGGVGGGVTHRPLTQQTHPTGPSCLQTGALLPARSALDGMAQGPAQLHSQWGCEALPSGMSREGQSGERGGKPGRSTGGRVEPGRPASHPLKESTAPRGGVGAERKTGAAAELPCLQQREACLLGSGTALRPHRHTHHSSSNCTPVCARCRLGPVESVVKEVGRFKREGVYIFI